ncbi:MAG: hypothetical protein LBM93_12200 [Oscillospiraceae bacterium]|jgi:hypothetical protein|nr:hypothetical protein [Oscillospiraceae bacterium]
MLYVSKIEGEKIFITDTSEGSETVFTESEIFELARNHKKVYGVNLDKQLIYPLMLIKKKKNLDMSCLGYMGKYSPTKIKYGFGVDYNDLGYSTHCEHKAQIHSREYLYWLEKDKLCSEMATLFFPFRQEAPIENDVFSKPFIITRRDGSNEEISPEEVAFTREKSLRGFPLDLSTFRECY